jgi:hypothetical protein
LITPLIMRGAFAIHSPLDSEEPGPGENSEEPVSASEFSMSEV